MKGINKCTDCSQYSRPLHKCLAGATKRGSFFKDAFYLDCPLPEVEEKETGTWIGHEMFLDGVGNIVFYTCSRCNAQREPTQYCPLCGARMKAEE